MILDHTEQNRVQQPDSPDSSTHNPMMGRRRLWYAALLAVTLIPLLGLPLASNLELPFQQSFLIGLGVFVGGVCHVASTLTFYADRDARTIMNGMKARFYLLPLVVIALSLLALIVGSQLNIPDQAVMSIFFLHLVWLYFHYQKQNYGLLAFAAASNGQRLPPITVKIILLPPLAGGLATIPQLLAQGLQTELPLANLQPILHTAAVIVYCIAAVIMLNLARQNRDLFSRPLVLIFALTAFGFFLPGLIIQNLDFAFWSYAIAHGLQYLLMVGIVSAQAKLRLVVLAGFFLSAIAGGWMLQQFAGNHALFICGILLTWVHFILDARLWRMSDSAVRPFLRQRFSFLFN